MVTARRGGGKFSRRQEILPGPVSRNTGDGVVAPALRAFVPTAELARAVALAEVEIISHFVARIGILPVGIFG
jgi:hypothetical protein